MSKVQYQVSAPVFNPADGMLYQRTRLVYDSNNDGILDSHFERVHVSPDMSGMIGPEARNATIAEKGDILLYLGSSCV